MYRYLGPLLEVTGIASYAAGSALNSSQAGEITCSKFFFRETASRECQGLAAAPPLTSNPVSHLSTVREL
jgi:hypothetical protein